MRKRLHRRFLQIAVAAAVCLPLLFTSLPAGYARSSSEGSSLVPRAYLPLVARPALGYQCPTSSQEAYWAGTAYQFDLDDPVRPAFDHADKNLALRSYTLNTSPTLRRTLLDLGSDDPIQPPQLATLFSPYRVPSLDDFYQVHHWSWAPSPDPGTRAGPITEPPATALGMGVTAGEPIFVPTSGYSIGGGMEVLVLFADYDSVTLRYTREDSSGSQGYTVHIDNLCTDPNLITLYNLLDLPTGPRYLFAPPQSRPYSYDLPNLQAGRRLGTARDDQIVVAVVDSGAFMDPRSCREWWQIRPDHPDPCPLPR